MPSAPVHEASDASRSPSPPLSAGARPRARGWMLFWLATVAASVAAIVVVELSVGPSRRAAPFPSPRHSPADVVRIQVEALARNGKLEADAGIGIAWRFASPANRAMTGPWARFVEIVRDPAYRPMLDHVRAEYGDVVLHGRHALQTVSLEARDGRVVRYLFQLTRQMAGPLAGCWLTDAVLPLGDRSPPAPSLDTGPQIEI